MKKPAALLLLLISFAWLAGCKSGSQPQPTSKNTKLESALKTEQVDGDSTEIRLLVRQKVADYMKAVQPEYQIKGISLSAFKGNAYIVGIDASSEKGRKTFDVMARLYIADDGESYWKIENLTQSRSDMLSGRALDSADKNDYEPPDEP